MTPPTFSSRMIDSTSFKCFSPWLEYAETIKNCAIFSSNVNAESISFAQLTASTSLFDDFTDVFFEADAEPSRKRARKTNGTAKNAVLIENILILRIYEMRCLHFRVNC